MSEPIIPSAQHRVVDETVIESVIEPAVDSLSRAKPPKKPSIFKRYQRPLIWVGVLSAGLLVLVWTRPDTSWLVDRINVLQSQVTQLQSDQQALNAQWAEQLAEQRKSLLESVTTHINDQVKPQMQTELAASVEQALTRPGDSTTGLGAASLEAESLDAFKINITQQIQQMEQTVARQLEQSRLAQTAQANTHPMTLSVAQLEQWIAQINMQWQLGGSGVQTRAQLLALDSALARGAVEQKTALVRLIGQDLGWVDGRSAPAKPSPAMQPIQAVAALKAAIVGLPAPTKPAINVVKPSETTQTTQTLSAGETLDTNTATQQLLGKLGELMSLKKRDDAQSLTQVEAILMHDVLLQRLSLLVDRLDWALQTQSQSGLHSALSDVRTLLKKSLSAHVATFEPLLTPLDSVNFEVRAPLSITQWNTPTASSVDH
jgi:hypothetical protein